MWYIRFNEANIPPYFFCVLVDDASGMGAKKSEGFGCADTSAVGGINDRGNATLCAGGI